MGANAMERGDTAGVWLISILGVNVAVNYDGLFLWFASRPHSDHLMSADARQHD